MKTFSRNMNWSHHHFLWWGSNWLYWLLNCDRLILSVFYKKKQDLKLKKFHFFVKFNPFNLFLRHCNEKNLFSSGRDHSFHKNHPTWRGVAVQVGQLFLLVKSELVMIGTPLLRNPMTESYVPGSWLWRMVLVLPLVVIFTTYAVSIMAVKRI